MSGPESSTQPLSLSSSTTAKIVSMMNNPKAGEIQKGHGLAHLPAGGTVLQFGGSLLLRTFPLSLLNARSYLVTRITWGSVGGGGGNGLPGRVPKGWSPGQTGQRNECLGAGGRVRTEKRAAGDFGRPS